jgi:membrane-bound lytic murein transglycosylase D
MECDSLRKFLFLIISLCFLSPGITSALNPGSGSTAMAYDEDEVAQRLESMTGNMVIKPRRDPIAMGYIRNYITRSRRSAELIIGRSILYFPMIEEMLKRHNLPAELKYLPVVESALNPRAVSPAGAGGLWQFMPATGKLEGLASTRHFDERFDPVKSTEAAMRHLTRLFSIYGDWELVLAAYNSGSGNVNRALKRSRSQDYWKIRRFLPRETRNYVPAFFAASYLCENYTHHAISPNLPDLDIQLTGLIKIYNGFSFFELASLTGLSIEMLETLNPAFTGGYIPENPEGHYLNLPKRVMPAVLEYMAAKLPDNSDPEPVFAGPVAIYNFPMPESYYLEHAYSVETEEDILSLEALAEKLKCSVYHLRIWNPENAATVEVGQQWKYFGPKAYKKLDSKKRSATVKTTSVASLPMREPGLIEHSEHTELKHNICPPSSGFLCVKVGQNAERLPDIARRFEGVSVMEMRKLNRVIGNPAFRPGSIVKIKSF